jgi:RimJ/RimL family protein N-acetyltransferase
MEIIDYQKNIHQEKVVQLFFKIYPNRPPEKNEQMGFDEKAPRHVCTKLAFVGDELAGQTNVCLLQDGGTVANIGYHLDPRFRQQGIGYALASAAIATAKTKGVIWLVVQIEGSNSASLALARKLGFTEPTPEFLAENENYLKYKKLDRGICLNKKL